MVEAGHRAARLTQQLLAFGRRQILAPVLVDLNISVMSAEKLLRRLIGEHIELALALAGDLAPALVDPGQLETVIINLAVNARDAMPTGGRLIISTQNVQIDEHGTEASEPLPPPGAYVELTVADTGMGMDAETRARIFEPFFTTKENGRGTGLGLSTVYGIVKQSRGHVWVHSEPGRGTTFRIYLPQALASSAVRTARPPHHSIAALTGHETILVVDDNDAVRQLVIRLLEQAGYQTLSATTGDHALRIAARHSTRISLVITDVIMPRMDGPQLVGALARANPGLRVLYMSGHTDDAVLLAGVATDTVAFLGKPFTRNELLRKVRDVLDARIAPSVE